MPFIPYDLPPSQDGAWSDIVTGKVQYDFEFLAVKILLGRLRMIANTDPSPAMIENCTRALRDLFAVNSDMPSAQRDLKKIFGSQIPLSP